MDFEDHVSVSKVVLGAGFEEVHRWLDELYTPENPYIHTLIRHHKAAITQKFKPDTPEYRAVILHLVCDYSYKFNIFLIPETHIEVMKLLITRGVLPG